MAERTVTMVGKKKAPAEPKRTAEPPPVSTNAAERVADTKGDTGFRGGRRPDTGNAGEGTPAEPARPRNTGRQGS